MRALRPHIAYQFTSTEAPTASINFCAPFEFSVAPQVTVASPSTLGAQKDNPSSITPLSSTALLGITIERGTPLTYAPVVSGVSPKLRRTSNEAAATPPPPLTIPLSSNSIRSESSDTCMVPLSSTLRPGSLMDASPHILPDSPRSFSAANVGAQSGTGPASFPNRSVTSEATGSLIPVSESGLESRKAVVLFVSPTKEDCRMVARIFASRLTHYLAWGGDCARMFTVAGLQVPTDGTKSFLPSTDVAWEEALFSVCLAAAEFLGTQQVLGLTATPTAVIFGDFASEASLAAAERIMLASWEALPGVVTSSSTIGYRYFRFGETWWEEDDTLVRGEASLLTRSFVDVSLADAAIRVTKSKMGVVCSTVVSYLTQVLPMLTYVHLCEPRTQDISCDSSTGQRSTMASLPPLFFTRHGQSEYNIEDRLGGNPALTPAGEDDARVIGRFFEREVCTNPNLFGARDAAWESNEGFEVWCSQLQRTQQTAQPTADILTQGMTRRWRSLNEIHAGVCEDMTNQEVMGQFPSLHNFRKLNKVAFRYPSGESYLDLMIRLKPVLLELEATRKCIVVVAHQAVLRTLLSYFGGPPVEEAVTAECPHRTVWCCTFDHSGSPRLATISLPSDRGADQWKGW
jgi:broad specificity phosphatase PhoE